MRLGFLYNIAQYKPTLPPCPKNPHHHPELDRRLRHDPAALPPPARTPSRLHHRRIRAQMVDGGVRAYARNQPRHRKPVRTRRVGTRKTLAHRARTGKQGYDQVIVLPGSLKSALIAFATGIKQRTGYVGESRYLLLNDIRKLDKTALP